MKPLNIITITAISAVQLGIHMGAASRCEAQNQSLLTVRVFDSAGEPVAYAPLSLYGITTTQLLRTDAGGEVTISYSPVGELGDWCVLALSEHCEYLPASVNQGEEEAFCSLAWDAVQQAGRPRSAREYIWIQRNTPVEVIIELYEPVAVNVTINNNEAVGVFGNVVVGRPSGVETVRIPASDTLSLRINDMPSGNIVRVCVDVGFEGYPCPVVSADPSSAVAGELTMPNIDIQSTTLITLPPIQVIGTYGGHLSLLQLYQGATLIRDDGAFMVPAGVSTSGEAGKVHGYEIDRALQVPAGRYYIVPGTIAADDIPWKILDLISEADPMLLEEVFVTVDTAVLPQNSIAVDFTSIIEQVRKKGSGSTNPQE